MILRRGGNGTFPWERWGLTGFGSGEALGLALMGGPRIAWNGAMRSILWLSLIAGLSLAGCDRRDVPVTTMPSSVAPATEEPIVPPPAKMPPTPAKLPAPLHKPQPPGPEQAAAADGDQPGPGGDVAPPGDEPPAADAVPAPPTDGASPAPGTIPPEPDTTEAALKNPEEVIGHDLAQISRLLGEPAFRTEQPP